MLPGFLSVKIGKLMQLWEYVVPLQSHFVTANLRFFKCMYMNMHTQVSAGAHRGQKRALDTLQLKLQVL